ncbi:hypothetical protein TCAL_06560 [Tigriopus californicus]|uniref:Uncharacterized protein n=1 Tax=Tigriopus californicus TaxID=6832 RepID=A0A553PP72_TIGCA|nr:hypothetical protein TCAL_06560 [Tigriopus californicus]|eukprot:TCALIF_06560-PA protein Name:"Protein of unknown function" AED:0.10 eAED:0.10 QI:0/0.66/0.75/0.75/1/1/4/77/287
MVTLDRLEETTCSEDAFHRGPGQKVIGTCFYGDTESESHQTRLYFEGISENLEAMAEVYPDWTMRIYFNESLSKLTLRDICDLACEHDNLDLCHVGKLPMGPEIDDVTLSNMFPMMWRFLPLLDPQVTIFLSRDLDSVVNRREMAAVAEFIESDHVLHIMRDHPKHELPIMGGLWGCKVSSTLDKWKQIWPLMLQDEKVVDSTIHYGMDQYALDKYVWPWAQELALVHDSFNCDKFRTPFTRAFPTQRLYELNNFVGSIRYSPEYQTLWETCPENCRPKDHPDWEYC